MSRRKIIREKKTAVEELEEYISKDENRNGEISLSKAVVSTKSQSIWREIEKLKDSLREEESKKQGVYASLKQTNEVMTQTIVDLQKELGSLRESMKYEFHKFDTLSTDRLLNINPHS